MHQQARLFDLQPDEPAHHHHTAAAVRILRQGVRSSTRGLAAHLTCTGHALQSTLPWPSRSWTLACNWSSCKDYQWMMARAELQRCRGTCDCRHRQQERSAELHASACIPCRPMHLSRIRPCQLCHLGYLAWRAHVILPFFFMSAWHTFARWEATLQPLGLASIAARALHNQLGIKTWGVGAWIAIHGAFV